MKTVKIQITSCKQCPFFKIGNIISTDGFDSGEEWICTKADKLIGGFVEWYEVDKIQIPEWCPLSN